MSTSAPRHMEVLHHDPTISCSRSHARNRPFPGTGRMPPHAFTRASPGSARQRGDRPAGRPGQLPVHAGNSPDDVPRPALDDAPVRRFRHRGRVEPPLSLPPRSGRDRPERRLRPADADRLRLRPCARGRRGGPRRRRHRLARGHGAALRRHPARPRVDLDDDQRDRHHPSRAVRRRGQAPGRRSARTGRHRAERHPEGVRGARHLHLSAAGFAPRRHRRRRLLRAGASALAPHLHQRLPHP